MTRYLYANNATTTLAQSVSATATVINVASGEGSLFPSPSTGEAFAVTFVDSATGLQNEIAYCTARSGDALTITRGQEGKTAQEWSAGDTVANYITAGVIESWLQEEDIAGLQEALGFTPVEQGGGSNQTTDKINIGQDESYSGMLRLAIAGVDKGDLLSSTWGATISGETEDLPGLAMWFQKSTQRPAFVCQTTTGGSQIIDIPNVEDVEAVQTSLTDFQTQQSDQNGQFESEIAARVPTNATNDGTNAPITLMNYYLGTDIPWFSADGVQSNLAQTNPGTGWNAIKNITVYDENGALTVLDSTNSTNTYAPSSSDIQSDTISITKIGDLVIQTFEVTVTNPSNGGAGSAVVTLPQALTKSIQFSKGNALGGTQGATNWIPSVNVLPTSLTEITVYADNLQNLNWTQAVTIQILVIGS